MKNMVTVEDMGRYLDRVEHMKDLLRNNSLAQVARHMNVSPGTIERCIQGRKMSNSTVLKVIGKYR